MPKFYDTNFEDMQKLAFTVKLLSFVLVSIPEDIRNAGIEYKVYQDLPVDPSSQSNRILIWYSFVCPAVIPFDAYY